MLDVRSVQTAKPTHPRRVALRSGPRSRQTGASAMVMLLGLVALVSVVTLLLKLGPHYIDWQNMQSVMGGLPEKQVHSMGKSEIRDALAKRFRINNLRDFKPRDVVTIDRSKEGTLILIDYERREHLLFNIDVVLSFSEKYQYR